MIKVSYRYPEENDRVHETLFAAEEATYGLISFVVDEIAD